VEIPDELVLTLEEISYLRHSQLAQLTGTPPNYFSAWKWQRGISERKLEEVAQKLNLSASELLQVLEARRRDAEKIRQAQAKADRLIRFMDEQRSIFA